MTRKDFELIAKGLREIENEDVRVKTAKTFADELEKTNPRFNRALFLKAATGKIMLGA